MPTNLLDDLNVQSADIEQKTEIIKAAAELVDQRVLIRLFESLPQEKRDELTKLLKQPDKHELEKFMAVEAPDYALWAEEETEAVKKELSDLGNADL